MSNFYDNLNKLKQGIHLSAEAKQKGKEQLLHFMFTLSLVEGRAHEKARGTFASWFAGRSILMRAGAAFAVFVVVGAGTALGAENALPGDALYAVKLHVNEKIRSVAAISAESEARLDADLAAKRLDEASQLSLEGRMSAEAETKIAANFEA